MKHLLLFGLGSNLGNSQEVLGRALQELGELYGELRVASFYRSAPISKIPQPDFYNTVAAGRLSDVDLGRLERAREALGTLKAIEHRAGRTEGPRFGPRCLDIDLLLFGELQSDEEHRQESGSWLTLPHPRLRQRRFVLEPLAELFPDLRLPPDGAPVGQLLEAVGEQGVVRLPISTVRPSRGPGIAASEETGTVPRTPIP